MANNIFSQPTEIDSTLTVGGNNNLITTGQIGIGTTSPAAKLHVVGQSSDGIRLERSDVSGNAYTQAIQFYDSVERRGYIGFGSAGDDNLILNADAGNLRFRVANADHARLTPTGLGIGTTSPSYKLDVAGQGRFTSYLNVDATVGIRSSGWVHLHRYGSNTNVAVGLSGTNVNLLVNNGNIETQQNIKSRGFLLFDNDGDFAGGNYYTMEDHIDGYFRMGYAFNSNLVISTAGNIGMGTTLPTAGLDVSRSMGGAWLASFKNTNNSGHGLIIQAGGTSGTRYITQWKDAAGTERFHMDDTGEAYFQNSASFGGNVLIGGSINIDNRGDYITFYGNNSSDHSITSRNSSGSADDDLRINSYDSVLINLDSNNNNGGNSRFAIGRHGGGSGSISDLGLFYVEEGGNVGIGTTSPGSKLDVVGDVKLQSYTNGVLSTGSTGLVKVEPSMQNFSLGESYAANLRELYYRTGKTVYPNDLGYTIAQLLQQNLYHKSSLILKPTATEDGSLTTTYPTDGTGDFTFSRNADIEATRVNASGLIEKAKVNLLLQSNTFDTTWTRQGTGLTSGQSGYDGSSDAWLLNVSTTGVFRFLLQSTNTNAVLTNSMYVKAGTTDFIGVVDLAGSSNCIVWFDLGAGEVGTIVNNNGNYIDSSIESVGGGWYRCSASFKPSTAGTALWFVADGDGSNNANAGDNVYIQDAGQNYGLVAQDYVETTTTAVVEGLTADLPRLDYSGGASCPSLLLEPSRTNTLSQSEYYGGWTTNNTPTLEDNELTSPEGVNNAYKFTTNAISEGVFISSSTLTSGGKYTYSVFLKHIAGTEPLVRLRLQGGAFTTNAGVIANIQNGTIDSTIGSVTSDIEDYGNGWYRVIFTGTAGSTATTNFTIYSYTANSFEWGVYGAQLEEGSYPTSYIPTYGEAANRGADSASKTGISSLIGQTEGTILLDLVGGSNGVNVAFRASDGTNNNRVQFEWSGSASANYIVSSGGSIQALISGIYCSQGTRHKVALAYKQNDFVIYLDGSQVGSDTSGAAPTSLTQIEFSEGAAYPYTGDVNQALLFKTRLTNAELASLTTI